MSAPCVNIPRLINKVIGGPDAPFRGRGAISDLLEEIACQTGSYGCILWRSRWSDHKEASEVKQLSMMGAWFQTQENIALPHIAAGSSCSGAALLKGVSMCNAIDEDERNDYRHHPFIVRHALFKALSCKVELADRRQQGQARDGAITLYRQKGEAPFMEGDVEALRCIAEVVPGLWQAIHHQTSFVVLERVHEIVHAAPATSTEASFKNLLMNYCDEIQQAFSSLEVSVFLEDENKHGEFRCAHTIPTTGHGEKTLRQRYRPALDSGFSGLAMFCGIPIRVRDTMNPRQEVADFSNTYTGFKGHTSRGIGADIQHTLKAHENDSPRPLSLMVTPLQSDGRLLGFLRCWTTVSGPAYYLDEDLQLLRQAARPLATMVARWEREVKIRLAWEDLADAGGKSRYTWRGKKSARKLPWQLSDDLSEEVLAMLDRLMSRDYLDTANTIRLLDEATNELYIRVYPRASTIGMPEQAFRLAIGRRFPLEGPHATSIAARVFKNATPEFISPVEECREYRELFPGVRQLIVVPVADSDDKVYGVLDVRNRSARDFPDYAVPLALTLARLLGLHYGLAKSESEKLEAQRKASQARDEQQRDGERRDRQIHEAFQDIAHQLKGPISSARRRIEVMQLEKADGLSKELANLHAMLRRAELFSKLVNLFADLARGRSLDLRGGSSMAQTDLVNLLNGMCVDSRTLIRRHSGIIIDLDKGSVLRNAPPSFSPDVELLSQALHNVLDNAVKYSDPDTTIRVFADTSRKGYFYIAVTNKGARIEESEINDCKRRYWRKPGISQYTGEGSGLGLYIVDNIMRAHKGWLEVVATRKDGVTEVRLVFPN